MNDRSFIAEIGKYPELYDTTNPGYHDYQIRGPIWKTIAKVSGQSAVECRSRWKRIRDNYRRAKRYRVTTGKDKLKERPTRFENELSFLAPFIDVENSDKRRRNYDDEEDESDYEESTYTTSPNPYETYPDIRVKSDLSEPAAETTELISPNPVIVDFFTCLGRTVATFPMEHQLAIRAKIFQIVNETETQLYGVKDPIE